MKNKIWLLMSVIFVLSIAVGYSIEGLVNKELVGRPNDWYQVVLDCGQRDDGCHSVACFERGDYYTCCCSSSYHPLTCCSI